jgi:predicted dehydrogenase
VRSLFDPAKDRAAKFAAELGGSVAGSAEAMFADPEIDIVLLFVPPWIRTDLWLSAANAGKHVLATKPLASSVAECDRVLAASGKTRTGVLYGRSGDDWAETAKGILAGGELGALALYRQDWLHHYPQWNTWALDPKKNGGPFMDAMIHNLNLARYLMGRPLTGATFFSEKLAHPDLTCADTEMLKAEFAGNGSALLFITWAADLAVHSTAGNDREHIDLFYLVTDRGWRITKEWIDGTATVVASRNGEKKSFPAQPSTTTVFDQFAEAINSGKALPETIVSPEMAADDIRLLRELERRPGEHVTGLDLG